MKASLLLKLLPSIREGRISISTLARETRLGETVLKELLTQLSSESIGKSEDSYVIFSISDKLRAALLAMKLGSSTREVSRLLDWRTFENFAAEILHINNYKTYHNVSLRKPRVQLDLVGQRDDFAICIDCKHWSRLAGPAKIRELSHRQLERTRAFVHSSHATKLGIFESLPVLVTLQQEPIIISGGVPIVAIDKFPSFLNELPSHILQCRVVKATTRLSSATLVP